MLNQKQKSYLLNINSFKNNHNFILNTFYQYSLLMKSHRFASNGSFDIIDVDEVNQKAIIISDNNLNLNTSDLNNQNNIISISDLNLNASYLIDQMNTTSTSNLNRLTNNVDSNSLGVIDQIINIPLIPNDPYTISDSTTSVTAHELAKMSSLLIEDNVSSENISFLNYKSKYNQESDIFDCDIISEFGRSNKLIVTKFISLLHEDTINHSDYSLSYKFLTISLLKWMKCNNRITTMVLILDKASVNSIEGGITFIHFIPVLNIILYTYIYSGCDTYIACASHIKNSIVSMTSDIHPTLNERRSSHWLDYFPMWTSLVDNYAASFNSTTWAPKVILGTLTATGVLMIAPSAITYGVVPTITSITDAYGASNPVDSSTTAILVYDGTKSYVNMIASYLSMAVTMIMSIIAKSGYESKNESDGENPKPDYE